MAVDYFLKLDGVTGESTDQQHTGEIELASWSWGATNPPNIGSQTGGAGTGRVHGLGYRARVAEESDTIKSK